MCVYENKNLRHNHWFPKTANQDLFPKLDRQHPMVEFGSQISKINKEFASIMIDIYSCGRNYIAPPPRIFLRKYEYLQVLTKFTKNS